MEERRRYPRLSVHIKVEYMVLDQKEADFFITGSKNISSGGICIIVFEKLELGVVLKLRFLVPGLNNFILAKGKVVWIREIPTGYFKDRNKIYEVGIEFVDIREDEKSKIEEYIEKSKPS